MIIIAKLVLSFVDISTFSVKIKIVTDANTNTVVVNTVNIDITK